MWPSQYFLCSIEFLQSSTTRLQVRPHTFWFWLIYDNFTFNLGSTSNFFKCSIKTSDRGLLLPGRAYFQTWYNRSTLCHKIIGNQVISCLRLGLSPTSISTILSLRPARIKFISHSRYMWKYLPVQDKG